MSKYTLNIELIRRLSAILFLPTSELVAATSIPTATWYKIINNSNAVTIKQVLSIANGLCIPARRLFSSSNITYIGHASEYVVHPYKECYYNPTAFQDIIKNRPDCSWKQAAKVVGMSCQRLQDSLLAITRTPINRFLIVCNVFNIDPFEILIDPNPTEKPKANQQVVPQITQKDDVHKDIATLQQQMTLLKESISDLTLKYEKLLDDHKKLTRHIYMSIEHIDRYPTIASETPLEEK